MILEVIYYWSIIKWLTNLFSKFFDSVKSEVVGIMIVMCAIKGIIIGSPTSQQNIFSVKKPVDILKAVLDHIRMLENNLFNLPIFQVT